MPVNCRYTDLDTTKFPIIFLSFQVIYTAAVRANKYYSRHPINGAFTNDTGPTEIGSQVLIDILLLAKCGHFLHGESSVATLASFFNPEMKLFFVGHLEGDVLVVSCQVERREIHGRFQLII